MDKMNREEVEQEKMKKRLKENLRERESEMPQKGDRDRRPDPGWQGGGGGRTPGWSESIIKMKRKKDGDKITRKIHACLDINNLGIFYVSKCN